MNLSPFPKPSLLTEKHNTRNDEAIDLMSLSGAQSLVWEKKVYYETLKPGSSWLAGFVRRDLGKVVSLEKIPLPLHVISDENR
jgi:hypothetical protein